MRHEDAEFTGGAAWLPETKVCTQKIEKLSCGWLCLTVLASEPITLNGGKEFPSCTVSHWEAAFVFRDKKHFAFRDTADC